MNSPTVHRRRRSPATLLNQITIALGSFYLILIGSLVYAHGLFLSAAGDDYRAYRTGAQVAWTQGMSRAYDVEALRPSQEALVRQYGDPELIPADFVVLATPYLPIFVALFGPLLLFDPVPGFVLWSLLSVVAMTAYLLWFARRTGSLEATTVIPALLLSFPSIDNLQWGQVNVWILILFGEFFRSSLNGLELRSGLWLATLLWKPQALVLLVPSLVFTRRWRAIAGFGIGSVGVLAGCLAVGGPGGLYSYVEAAATVSGDAFAARPQYMTNWRAVAITLSQIVPTEVAWTLGAMVLGGTLLAVLCLWRAGSAQTQYSRAIVLLGTFAATGCASWHAHSHMALPMAIPLLYLSGRHLLPYKVLGVWLIGPYVSVAARLITGESAQLGLLIAHLYILGWSVYALWRGPLALASTQEGDHVSDQSPTRANTVAPAPS